MSVAVTFDTLKFTKRLEESGFSRQQAEAQAEAFREAQETNLEGLATKQDVSDIRRDVAELELRLIKWMVGTALASVGIIVTAFFAIIRMVVSG